MIYHSIVRQVHDAKEAGFTPNGVRCNERTCLQLEQEVPSHFSRLGKTSWGVKVTVVETPHGPLRLLYDKYVPDGAVAVTVAVPPMTRFPSRLYYDESGELVAEQA